MEEIPLNDCSIFILGSHLVQRSGTIWAILVEGQPSIIPVKFRQNLPGGSGGEVVKGFFLFIALAAILCSGAEPLGQFW